MTTSVMPIANAIQPHLLRRREASGSVDCLLSAMMPRISGAIPGMQHDTVMMPEMIVRTSALVFCGAGAP